MSTKGRYGTRAMVYIGEYWGKGPVSLRELAEKEDVSVKYMEQIVPLLKASGLIKSTRGARGGYVLARDPGQISLRDILQALEGSWSLVHCLEEETACGRTKDCITYEIWQDIQRAIDEILDSTTLAQIIDRRQRKGSKTCARHGR